MRLASTSLKMRSDIECRRAAGLSWNPETLRYDGSNGDGADRFMELRRDKYRSMALYLRPLLWAGIVFAPNARARARTRNLAGEYRAAFGPPSASDLVKSAAVVITSLVEFVRIRIRSWGRRGELVRQPPCRRVDCPGGIVSCEAAVPGNGRKAQLELQTAGAVSCVAGCEQHIAEGDG